MRLTCPNCAAQYNVPDTAISAKGRTVQCAKCHTSWHQGPAEPAAAKVTPMAAPQPVVQRPLPKPQKPVQAETPPAPVAAPTPKPEPVATPAPKPVAAAPRAPEPAPEAAPQPAPAADPAEALRALLGQSVSDDRDSQSTGDMDAGEVFPEHDRAVFDFGTPSEDDTPATPQAPEPEVEQPSAPDLPETSMPPLPDQDRRPVEGDRGVAAPDADDAFEELKARRARRRAERRSLLDDADVPSAEETGVIPPRRPAVQTEPSKPAVEEPVQSPEPEAATEEDDILEQLRSMIDEEDPKDTAAAPAVEEPVVAPAMPEPSVQTEEPTEAESGRRRKKRVRPPRPDAVSMPEPEAVAEPAEPVASLRKAKTVRPSATLGTSIMDDVPDEKDEAEPRTSRAPLGFAMSVLLFAIGAGVYVIAPDLGAAIPALAPVLESYASGIDVLRIGVQSLFTG